MTKTTIKAIEMTRAIRDKHALALQHATPSERIAFYREKARIMQTVASDRHVQQREAEPKAE